MGDYFHSCANKETTDHNSLSSCANKNPRATIRTAALQIAASFFFFFPWMPTIMFDDYSGTLDGVRKIHISALVTSPNNWFVALS